MKITLESTPRIVKFQVQRGQKPYEARVWEGHTESGIAIQVLIPRIAVKDEDDQAAFATELIEVAAPRQAENGAGTETTVTSPAFPLRMVL